MATENLADRGYVATSPYDSNDPPRFGQLVETAKSAFLVELDKYFDYKTSDATEKISEVLNIEKYALGASTGETSLQTVVNTIMAYADTPDQFPMISITSANVKQRSMNIGTNIVAVVQYAPSIVGTVAGPFNLDQGSDDPWSIEFITWPDGTEDSETTSTISFPSTYFSDPTAVTAAEICEFVNRTLALYSSWSYTSDGYIRISAGGRCSSGNLANYIEITDGTTALLSALGFTIGDSDTYLSADNLPRRRYSSTADMVVNIDVVTDSLTTRTELSDLVFSFFSYYMEKRRFQFYGRSYFDRDTDPEEWFHIILKNQFNWSAEVTKARQGGEQYDQVYAIRGSVPIFIEDFIDKEISHPAFMDTATQTMEQSANDENDERVDSTDTDLPDGDYTTAINYSK